MAVWQWKNGLVTRGQQEGTNMRCIKKWATSVIQVALGLTVSVLIAQADAATLSLPNTPLFLTTSARPNILLILDNSNSMDEAANGSAVGSDSPESKSEIARAALKGVVNDFAGRYNLGLMAYQQANVIRRYIHNAPYDVSFDPANYDPDFTGDRASLTKRYKVSNSSWPGNDLYYNIALPFYAGSNNGSAFCYSETALFDSGTQNSDGTPYDTYSCYKAKQSISDVVPTSSTEATNEGWSNYWFKSVFTPTDSDFAAGILEFGHFLAWDYVGETWFSNESPGGGYLHEEIGPVDSAKKTALLDKLGTSQFSTVTDTPIRNAGLTPLEGTLQTAAQYFSSSDTLAASEGGPEGSLPESCGKDYAVLVTDGLPSTDASGNAVASPQAGIDATAAAAAALKSAGVDTFVVGFALPQWVSATLLDDIAAAGGTGSSYLAGDSQALSQSLSDIFSGIEDSSGAGASLSSNTSTIVTGTKIYQSLFNSADWSGNLKALAISSSGSVGAASWQAATQLDLQNWDTGREILTWDGAQGVPFRWANLTSDQKTYLNDDPATLILDNDAKGESRVAFLRGDRSNEGTGNNFRRRSTVLGDLVHSPSVYVGEPGFNYPQDLETVSYVAFKAAHKDRLPVIYVGGNDGMLHAFNATTGDEVFGYVPGAVAANLAALTDGSYSHLDYVDGAVTVVDALVGGEWKTVLVGALRGGGQGYFALDVTDPEEITEANAASKVLWEFTDADDADLGYSYSEAAIVRLANGQWAAVFGNGYNATVADGHASTNGNAALFIVDIATGNLIKKIEVPAPSTTTPNGLASPAPVDKDGDGIVDTVYAGDLHGNLWAFDLSNTSDSLWDVAYDDGGAAIPLMVTMDADGNHQPISTRPEVVRNPVDNSLLVLFGTGKYLEYGDLVAGNIGTQSFYAVRDSGTLSVSLGRNDLTEQQILATADSAGRSYRLVSDSSINWATSSGWRMDFPESGEMVVRNPLIRHDQVVFTTAVPSGDVCSPGGSGWFMEVSYISGTRSSDGVLDVNDDGIIDADDTLTFDVSGTSVDAHVSGFRSQQGILSSPLILDQVSAAGAAPVEIKQLSGTLGGIDSVTEKSVSRKTGRVSWRQLR